MKRLLLLSVMMVLATLLALAWSPEGTAETKLKGEIRIGQTTSYVGGVLVLSEQERDGAKIACEEINKAGGLFGRKLVFISRDNENSPEKAVAQAKELCLKYKIDFALGSPRSSSARATSAVYQRYKVPTLLLCSMADEVMQMGNPYYMRLCNPNSVDGSAMAGAVNKAKFKRPGIFYLNDFWGMSQRKIMHREMKAMGLEVASEASFDMGAPDVSPQVMKILASKPDVVLLLAYSGDASTAVRTFKSQGYKGSFIGYSGLCFNPVRKAGGHDVDGIIFPAGWFCQGFYIWNRPGAIPLLLELEAKNSYGKYTLVNASPEIAVIDGYTAIYAIKNWLELAGERGLKDKDYFMDVVADNIIELVATDLSFPYGRRNMTAMTVDDIHLMQYVNGHIRVWEHDPRCVETFEATRVQAEEEVYSKGFTKGVTFKKYLARWQELLKENEAKVRAEIDAKLEKGTMSREYARKSQRAVTEILAYKF